MVGEEYVPPIVGITGPLGVVGTNGVSFPQAEQLNATSNTRANRSMVGIVLRAWRPPLSHFLASLAHLPRSAG
jgi:hypothetical protein